MHSLSPCLSHHFSIPVPAKAAFSDPQTSESNQEVTEAKILTNWIQLVDGGSLEPGSMTQIVGMFGSKIIEI